MRLLYSHRAAQDLASIANYLQQRSPSGANHVMQALRRATTFIADHPFAARATDLPNVHVKTVREYPFKIFYRVLADQDEIEIIHVRHSSREPWSIE